MGGSALAVGGGAPLLTAPITAKPDPITPNSHASTLHAGPHRPGPDRAWTWTDADRLAWTWTWTVGRRVRAPRHAMATHRRATPRQDALGRATIDANGLGLRRVGRTPGCSTGRATRARVRRALYCINPDTNKPGSPFDARASIVSARSTRSAADAVDTPPRAVPRCTPVGSHLSPTLTSPADAVPHG
jgi:hypothetical protein